MLHGELQGIVGLCKDRRITPGGPTQWALPTNVKEDWAANLPTPCTSVVVITLLECATGRIIVPDQLIKIVWGAISQDILLSVTIEFLLRKLLV